MRTQSFIPLSKTWSEFCYLTESWSDSRVWSDSAYWSTSFSWSGLTILSEYRF